MRINIVSLAFEQNILNPPANADPYRAHMLNVLSLSDKSAVADPGLVDYKVRSRTLVKFVLVESL
jgi:hypothetical protein